ncbi:MAG: hypothetical protein ACJ79A_06075 [Gemmatimonadaceae bacterium]
MIRRTITMLSLLALAAAPLAAQGANDPTHKVAGGALPAGWMGRTDRPTDKLTDAKFVAMGSGFHATSGPAAIFWNPKTVTSGPFTATTTVTQTKAPMHPEAYGIFFMGKDLDTPQQSYMYFLVRGDGKFLVNHRAGAQVHKVIDWTENAAVVKADANGKATNKLTVDATKSDSLRFLVNGKQVAALPANQFGTTNGLVGLRVNHNLDVHIAELTVTPKK